MSVKKKKHQKPTPTYKHSYGHYRKEIEAEIACRELQEEKPKFKFEVVKEKRSSRGWKKYCVCVMVSSKQVKKGSKKVKTGSK